MANDELLPSQYTETGYVSNQFTVGPALLWAPFLVSAHGVVRLSDARGSHIPADGFSFPYLIFSPENMSRHIGPFSPHLELGVRARSPCTCISIQRGPTRIPPSPWPFFSGIGIARGGGELR